MSVTAYVYYEKSFHLFYFAPFLYRKQQIIGKLRTWIVLINSLL